MSGPAPRNAAARTQGPALQLAAPAMDDEPPAELIDAAADASTPGEDAVVPASSGPAPSAAAIAARVPPATRALLAELFKAEISAVRRISRDQLR